MKKQFIGAAVLLLAAVGAFAAAKSTALDVVYIETPSGCIEARAAKCLDLGGVCQVEVFNVDETTSLGIHQIFRDPANPVTPLECETPYKAQ